MRPNIDLPQSMHGQMKDYADERDTSIDDAYIEVINRMMDEITPEHEGNGRKIPLGSSPPDTWTSINTLGENVGVHQAINLFSNHTRLPERGWLDYVSQPVQIKGGTANSQEDLRNMCEKIAPYLTHNEKSGEFSIEYPDSLIFGTGIDTFVNTIETKTKTGYETEKEMLVGVYVSPLGEPKPYPNYVLIPVIFERNNNSLTQVTAWMSVITDGFPMNRTDDWAEMMKRTGGIGEKAHDLTIYTSSVDVDEFELEPKTDNINPGYSTDRVNHDRCTHVLVENPWYGRNPSPRTRILDNDDMPYSLSDLRITNHEHFIAALGKLHSKSDIEKLKPNMEIQAMSAGPLAIPFTNIKLTLEGPAI